MPFNEPEQFLATIVDGKAYFRRDFRSLQGQCAPQAMDAKGRNSKASWGPFFTYLDVGCWGEKHRNFGVVYGEKNVSVVLLCDWDDGGSGPGEECGVPPVDAVLAHLGGRVSVRAGRVYRHCTEFQVNTDGNVLVLLGDLHLPVISGDFDALQVSSLYFRSTRESIDKELLSTQVLQDASLLKKANIRNLAKVLTDITSIDTDQGWHKLNAAGDIFKDGGKSLIGFIDVLERFVAGDRQKNPNARKARLHLVQMGDFYDLWMGLLCGFRQRGDGVVELLPGGSTCPGQPGIGRWLRYADQYNPVAARLHNCKTGKTLDKTTFIAGNHDSYLLRCTDGRPPREQKPFWIPQQSGTVLLEHGHEPDVYNRDGAWEGHAITQLVFAQKAVRWFDPDRRESVFLPYALKRARSRQMKIYVMAHTHAAYMAEIFLGSGT